MSMEKYFVCMSCKKGFDQRQDKDKKDDKTGFCPNCGKEMKIVECLIWR